ncbi:MAG: hypothetical protein P4M09_21990 [Devosia sp.]|nr:hypothetical protein [Devosia sp.]
MSIVIPNRSQTAGIPRQWDDTISAVDIALVTGDTPSIVTEDLEVAANQNLPALSVVGFDANGRLVKATSTVEATGALTFSGTGTAADTVTIGTTVYTLAVAPDVTVNEVKIGATAAETAANLAAAVNGGDGAGDLYGSATLPHPDVVASAAGAVVTITAKVGGTAGNSIATTEAGTGTSFGAATLTGGTATPSSRAIGVLIIAVVTDGSGLYKAAPVYRAGVFNPLALVWDASFSTEAEKLGAFRGAPTPTNIVLRRPKTATVSLP